MKQPWHKSSYSGGDGGNCVEVAEGVSTDIRDTRYPDLSQLTFTPTEWAAFISDVRTGAL